MSYTREEMAAAARFEAESVNLSQTVPCDVCEGRRTRRTTNDPAYPCSRCKATGRRSIHSDPMAAPHVDVSVPAFGGSIRLRSASGGMESLWIDVRDPDGAVVAFDKATGQHLAAAVRLTPSDARALSDLLRRYADTHRDTES